ncbi:MAG TPA: alpha/beta hydrolase [Gemmatimonadales bacterium]|nr:alpha/beta hydrolase [Gemmatimonadales bacterium]
MFYLALLLAADTGAHTFPLAITPAESVQVTIAGTGQPVVLIPSLFGCASCYQGSISLLTRAGYRTIVIEALGIGTGGHPEHADYSLTAQAERIAATLDRLGVRQAILVAHTVGASMAYRLSYRHPDLVQGIVSLDGGPAEAAATPGFRRALRLIPWLKWFGGVHMMRTRIRAELVRDSHDTSWVTDQIVSGFTAGPDHDLDAALKSYIAMGRSHETERLSAHLSQIHCPVLLVIGAAPHGGGIGHDELELLSARVPRFAVDSVPNTGLYVYAEDPAAVLAAVRRIAAWPALGAAATAGQ